jgi:hypothetical protein
MARVLNEKHPNSGQLWSAPTLNHASATTYHGRHPRLPYLHQHEEMSQAPLSVFLFHRNSSSPQQSGAYLQARLNRFRNVLSDTQPPRATRTIRLQLHHQLGSRPLRRVLHLQGALQYGRRLPRRQAHLMRPHHRCVTSMYKMHVGHSLTSYVYLVGLECFMEWVNRHPKRCPYWSHRLPENGTAHLPILGPADLIMAALR